MIRNVSGFINKAKAKWERTEHEQGEQEINKYEKETYQALLATSTPHGKAQV
jgi:hypothetical protein